MTERADQLHQDNAPAHSTALVQVFFWGGEGGGGGKESHHPGLSAPYSPDLSPCDFWLFPKLKSQLNTTVTQYTNSVNGVSLPTD